MSEQMKCPACGGEDFLVSHDARMTLKAYVEIDDDGDFVYRAAEKARYDDVEENYTLHCSNCDFCIAAAPEEWGDAFFPKPDVEGLLALRARMKGEAPPPASGDEAVDQGAST